MGVEAHFLKYIFHHFSDFEFLRAFGVFFNSDTGGCS